MSLLNELETQILASAHPFKGISDRSRSWLANWLATPAAGQTKTREEMCSEDQGIRDALLADMNFVGAHCARFGLQRQVAQAMRQERPSFSIELEDVLMARFVVAAKLTILCPDEP